jgi:hypothetical protein
MDPSEANLITEIEFWREMIELRQDSASTESVERMQQALALAELRHRLETRRMRHISRFIVVFSLLVLVVTLTDTYPLA